MRKQAEKIFLKNDDFYKKFGLKSKEFLMRKQAEKIFSKIHAETSRKFFFKNSSGKKLEKISE